MPATWRKPAGRKPAGLLAAAVFTAVLCNAAPPLTTIQDVLYKADGTRFDGVAQISWKSFQTADGSEIPQHTLSVRVANGSLRVLLAPTTNALQSALYTVKFNADGRTQFTEFWAVPPSAAPLKLREVRTMAPGPGQIEQPDTPVDIAEVVGLRTELDLRPARGASYIASRAAIINSAGAIDGALGQAGDCLRVDGTGGPCGSIFFVQFIDGETPGGTVNGVNTQFTLNASPAPASSLALFRNGILQRSGVDYTLSASTITFTSVSIPTAGDILQVSYRR